MTDDNQVTASETETRPASVGSMLVSIFTEPSKVFHRIKRKPCWVTPFLIFLIAITVMTVLTTPAQFEFRKQMIRDSTEYTPEQKDAILGQMEVQKQFMWLGAVAAPLMAAIFFFIGVGLLMLMGSVIMGGEAKFSQVASVTAWTSMIAIVGQLVKTGLIFMKGSIDVRTSLSILLPGSDMTSWPFWILTTFTDIFTIWSTIVTIIGIAIVYSFSKGRAAVAVLVPTVLGLTVAMLAGKIFGAM